jgi:hypothetical protein
MNLNQNRKWKQIFISNLAIRPKVATGPCPQWSVANSGLAKQVLRLGLPRPDFPWAGPRGKATRCRAARTRAWRATGTRSTQCGVTGEERPVHGRWERLHGELAQADAHMLSNTSCSSSCSTEMPVEGGGSTAVKRCSGKTTTARGSMTCLGRPASYGEH